MSERRDWAFGNLWVIWREVAGRNFTGRSKSRSRSEALEGHMLICGAD